MSKTKSNNKLERIDKIISNQTNYSRKEVHRLIYSGKIKVDENIIKQIDLKFDPEQASIYIDNQKLNYKKHIYIMMNKPAGVISASDDKKGDKTVVDLVPPELYREGLFPAGRLDKDSIGFVLITDDGDFAHRILSPKHHVEKTYEVLIDKHLSKDDITKLEDGIMLKDGTKFKPAKLTIINTNNDDMLVEIVITEGKYHQIKRMMAVCGANVKLLKRTKIGGLLLDEFLNDGNCREILNKELESILCNIT